jgi:hypothetical protein
MTDILPAASAEDTYAARNDGVFGRLWKGLCYSFATPVTLGRDDKSRPRGPWDRPNFTVYVTGLEVSCIEDPVPSGAETKPVDERHDAGRYAEHRFSLRKI